MWGFNEIAKKAQELQEQAAAAVAASSNLSTASPSSLFNLDSIRHYEEESQPPPTPKLPDHERPVVAGDVSSSSWNALTARVVPYATTTTPTPQRAALASSSSSFARGKLIVPSKSGAAVTTTTVTPDTPTRSNDTKATISTAAAAAATPTFGAATMKEIDSAPSATTTAGSIADTESPDRAQPAEANAANDINQTIDSVSKNEPDNTVDNESGWEDPMDTTEQWDDEHDEETFVRVNVPSDPDTEASVLLTKETNQENVPMVVSHNQTAVLPDSVEKDIASPLLVSPDYTHDMPIISSTLSDTESDINGSLMEEAVEKNAPPLAVQMDRDGEMDENAPFRPEDGQGVVESQQPIVNHDLVIHDAREKDSTNTKPLETTERTRGTMSEFIDNPSEEASNDNVETKIEHLSHTARSNLESEFEKSSIKTVIHKDGELNPTENQSSTVPEELLEQFSEQLRRLEENFQGERNEMLKRHSAELEELKRSFNHNQCIEERRNIEKILQTQIKERDAELYKLSRLNENHKFKLDALQKEIIVAQQLVKTKHSDMEKIREENLRSLRALEKQMREVESRESASQKEVDEAKRALNTTKSEMETLQNENLELKVRIKNIATELKDRRIENRELQAKVDEQHGVVENLQGEIDSLKYKLSNQDRSRTEKDEEIENLRSKLATVDAELKKAGEESSKLQTQADKLLTDYKKKAQNSLALANSRAAAAMQAKEEAELEARAARATADSAMDRAIKAEIASKQSVVELKVRVDLVESEKREAVKLKDEAIQNLATLQENHDKLLHQFEKATNVNEQLSEELLKAGADIREEQATITRLNIELLDAQNHSKKLKNEIVLLRGQLQRAESSTHDDAIASKEINNVRYDDSPNKRVASDNGAIEMLQEELRDAKSTIEDLREALAHAVALNETHENSNGQTRSIATAGSDPQLNNDENTVQPFFYAMEKQAELNTARREINRLANLLSNAQSEKMEAFESKEEMRRRMEESEARLKRFEKLASDLDEGKTTETRNGSSNSLRSNSGAVNIEYLKNIMLSYLSAKTLADKKALVPVIGAVLCLTPDEQKIAMRNLEQSASLGSVSSSLFETFGSKLI